MAYLDRQITDHEVVGLYLRLQRDAVRKALGQADQPPEQGPRGRKVKGGGPVPALAQPPRTIGYVVQQKRTPAGPEPALIHLADCSMSQGTPHPIRPDEARAALTDPTIEPCNFCRPDTELGCDLD